LNIKLPRQLTPRQWAAIGGTTVAALLFAWAVIAGLTRVLTTPAPGIAAVDAAVAPPPLEVIAGVMSFVFVIVTVIV